MRRTVERVGQSIAHVRTMAERLCASGIADCASSRVHCWAIVGDWRTSIGDWRLMLQDWPVSGDLWRTSVLDWRQSDVNGRAILEDESALSGFFGLWVKTKVFFSPP
jgi:hypothetical protein